MFTIQKRYQELHPKEVTGYRWLHFSKAVLDRKEIAVYIYILYNIIICNHVTGVSSELVYVRTNNIFSLPCIYNSGGYNVHTGYKRLLISFLPFFIVVTTWLQQGYNRMKE